MKTMTLLACLATLIAPPAMGQEPPEEERRVVDATLIMLRDGSAGAVDRYLEQVVAPGSPQPRAEMRAALAELRSGIGQGDFDLRVEKTPAGVQLRFRRGEKRMHLDLALAPEGLMRLGLSEPLPGEGPGDVAGAHVLALEQSHLNENLVAEFEAGRLSARFLETTTPAQRRELLQAIADAARQAGGVMFDQEDETWVLTLAGRERFEVRFTVEPAPPHRIDTLSIRAAQDDAQAFGWDAVGQHFADLAEAGFSGVVKIVRDGETVLDEAYGEANPELGYPMRRDTIFGIGSTPIDFTAAGIFKLADAGRISLDDPVARYLDGVPADKAGMTIRHILDSQTGLPDFHDRPGDWETDLAWIDRAEAVRRIMEQPLKFAPGTGRAHSHSAWGLAAAIIEVVSGLGYFEFLSETFFAPAGMTRTGMYGDAGGFALADFAVGQSPLGVGLPNIPPNWGPTSWLVMGSGGMYSTLGDLRRFYDHVGTGGGLAGQFAAHFTGERMVIGGSQRGFHIVEVQRSPHTWAMFLVNADGRTPEMRDLTRSLERLVLD